MYSLETILAPGLWYDQYVAYKDQHILLVHPEALVIW